MFKFLLSQFIKQNGRNPNNLEMILLRQKAANQAVDERKVVSMFDRSPVNPDKTIIGGRNVDETEEQIRQRLMDQNKKGLASMKKKLEDPEEKAMGGRIGYKLGTGKKSVEGLLDLIRNKFGKKSITTADKAPTPSKTLERDMFKTADKNFKNKRMLDDDEYQDFLDEVGGADQLEAYDFDGTVGDAKRILKEQKKYMDDMELEYKKGNLDPGPGEKGRKEFLQKKLDEVEASGDQRLMTPDEIEELSSFDSDSQMGVAKTLAPKMVERMQLKQKYPGITDDLLDKILIDDNMQRKAELLATIDEAFRMMEKGKSTDEILDTMKNVTRTKQADGGRIGLKAGMTKRNFLKLMGGVGAGIAGLKSGLVNIMGKGTGKEVAKEVVQKSTTGSPPPYFFKLAEKIKKLGDDATATTDRTIAKTLKSKDGKSTYVLEEDVTSGDTIIKKINKEGDEMMTDVEIMELKKGEVVMGKDGKPVKVPDEYEEVTEVNARIEGDVFNDPYYSDGIKIDEIMKEVGEQAPSIKKADGGIMRAGYQMGGDVAYDATNQDIYGSSAITVTPDTVMGPGGNQIQDKMGKPGLPSLAPPPPRNPGNPGGVGFGGEEFIVRRPGTPIQIDPNTLYEAKGPYNRSAPVTRTIEERKKIAEDMNNASTGLMRNDGTRVNITYENIPEREDNMATMPVGNNNQMGILPVMPPKSENSPIDTKSILQDYGNSDLFSRRSTADVRNFTFGGKEMSGSSTYIGGLRKYLDSIGKGDLLQLPEENSKSQQLAPNYGESPLASTVRTNMLSGGIARMLGE